MVLWWLVDRFVRRPENRHPAPIAAEIKLRLMRGVCNEEKAGSRE